MAREKRTKRKDRKVGMNGVVHVHATFNNTIISITDPTGFPRKR